MNLPPAKNARKEQRRFLHLLQLEILSKSSTGPKANLETIQTSIAVFKPLKDQGTLFYVPFLQMTTLPTSQYVMVECMCESLKLVCVGEDFDAQ